MYKSATLQVDQGLITTWVLIADGKQAQVYESHATIRKIPLEGTNIHHYFDEKSGHSLIAVPHGEMKAESINSYEIGHDKRGTTSSSNSPTHNTYEPHGDIDGELKRRFAKAIVEKLHQACTEKLFMRLVLVAPARMIGDLKEEMSADLRGHIVAELPKDLTHLHGQELMNHLQTTLTEAHAI